MMARSLTHRLLAGSAMLGVLALAPSALAVNVLINPGFEDDDASVDDVFGPAGWGFFNDAYVTRAVPANSGDQAFKTFGPFFNGGGAGIVQSTPASPGETWTASAFAFNASSDPIGTNNFAVVKLEFLDAGNAVISAIESTQINEFTAQDTWSPYSVQGVAPEGTAAAQIVLVHVQLDPITGGAVFFDDAVLEMGTAPLIGDTDGDGDIDDFDLIKAIVAYTGSLDPGVGGKTIADGDTDNDQDVDDFDLINMIVGYTGSLSAPTSAVPEPTSVALLGLGGLALIRRRH